MRVSLLFLTLLGLFFSCNQATVSSIDSNKEHGEEYAYYGEKFNIKDAISGKELKEKMTTVSEMDVVVTGSIIDVCKKEGCWLNLDIGDNAVMQVRMKDHKFFVPEDCEGRMAIIKGHAYMDTTSVEQLRHFASDKGSSQSEIDAIIEPKVELVLEAAGVGIK